MDTVVSNLPPGMGQGERQTVHPFFHQVPPNYVEPNTSHTPSATTTNSCSFIPSQSEQTKTQKEPHIQFENMSRDSKMQEPSALNPEEDPNASRRKRRKIDKTKKVEHEASLRAGMSGWLGQEIAAPVEDSGLNTTTETLGSQTPLVQEIAQPTPEENKSTSTPSANPTEPFDPDRKVLKVNSNGKLLGSPPKTFPGISDQNKSSGNRRRRQKVKSRVVSIQYTSDEEGKTGKLIDDILNGKLVYNTSRDAPIPAKDPKLPSKRGANKPSKPTHPFFAKKPPTKPQAEAGAAIASPNQTAGTSNSAIPDRPSSSPFGRPKNKFPELAHALWPPRDFHAECHDFKQNLSTRTPIQYHSDRKKSKVPAIRVGDDENVFLKGTSLARTAAKSDMTNDCNIRPTLRVPVRETVSGRVLQRAVDAQLSWAFSNQPSAVSLHPSISKLRSTLHSSLSAFDRGKYESQLWTHKYSPKLAEEVLQVGRETQILRDWLQHLEITAVDTGKQADENKKAKHKHQKKKKNRNKADKMDDFIVSSGEEASEMDNLSGSDDELAGGVTVSTQRTVVRSGDPGAFSQSDLAKAPLANAILLSGPSGCGKTASVYAVAKELDYEVFEINPGSRRNARDMLEKVGDMTQNHLVHLLNESEDLSSKNREPIQIDDSKQNNLMGFFKNQPSKKTNAPPAADPTNQESETDSKRPREQKQSLILLEEADILFEEDKSFWTGVLTLISQSRRPIVITCNDESLVPTQDMSLHAKLRYQRPPPDFAIDYLLLVAANEGHLLKRDAMNNLYNGSGHDIRRSLIELNFWCQMGVGSEKAGLDWILPLWPPQANVDENGDRLRVLSLNTYQPYMGWLNRDLFLTESSLESEIEASRNTLHWWRLGLQELEDASVPDYYDSLPADQLDSENRLEQLNLLTHQAEFLDSRSALDILSSGYTLDKANDALDTDIPPMLESHRSNYVDAHPLLQSDLRPEYSSLGEDISLTLTAMHSRRFRSPVQNTESSYTARIMNGWAKSGMRRQIYPSTKPGYQKVFGPIMRARHWTSTGRLAPSFEGCLAPITEELAPYIRAIMAFDGRLKVYRDTLYTAWVQEQGTGEKRARTTRASRAALEGSDKAFTRRERWFPEETNYFLVQATGMPEWQDSLIRMGHFNVQPTIPSTSSDIEMGESQ
ncbi:hypothetical protein N7478_013002 [Penicillium angulare]|uniref:uncharacterized protein n=1 Tax=Penicillium angulare TaxID=116970 RepID=UPI0025406816|nr:uncharacterized protein N7478_013002 [Penicillium angulare]KAJ5256898.1 hypothetical protein N7478_013002 [Penicillium angulare]